MSLKNMISIPDTGKFLGGCCIDKWLIPKEVQSRN